MLTQLRPPVWAALVLILAGCASRPEVAVTPPTMYVPAQVAEMPKGASPGMRIPARLADGSYATPNRVLTPAATVWHLRAALNVAALACRGVQETTTVAQYNALLQTQKAALKDAEANLSAEYRASGGDWQDRYDDSMTRLYNYFSQSFARDAFCANAAAVLADSATVAPTALPTFAATRLPMLDRPFTDFYAAYDAWRARTAFPNPVIAMNTPVRRAPSSTPRLQVDVADLGE
ncbi:hypothetical protein M0208_13085 [Sphingomonas sp. SUN019]|uniref:hypothetical protein n=1 Tax=Sphingomonas sp. SUN019 TaxID=2937788 RepID=UPI00216475DC|nr:hypothetical protein [Sphingomonas sp. SUN019]UVO52525.1 hypothetical protein M0208_13085 [Sphingomonas sp. SUN019]